MTKVQSLFETFKAEDERLVREAAELDREMRKRLGVKERELEAACAARTEAETELQRQKENYAKLAALVEAEERERLETSGKTEADLLAGRVSPQEYFKDGATPAEIERRSKGASAEKLGNLVGAIRKQAARVLDLEKAELKIKLDVYYMNAVPAQTLLARQRDQIKALEAGITNHLTGWPATRARLEEIERIDLDSGFQWFGLDEAQVRDLRFDVRIPDEALPQLEGIIREITGRGKKWRIRIKGFGRGTYKVSHFEE